MKVLVLGGTGTVGSQVVQQLLARGASVSVLTRDAGKAAKLPAGVTSVTGDLLEPATVRSAFKGFDSAFILNGLSTHEAHEGLMAVNGAKLGGVKRIVFLSIHRLDEAPHPPHFGAKIGIEAAVRASGLEWTIIRPNNFHQNDIWFKDAIMQYNVYPQPIGDAGLSRVDVRDIAEVAALALTTDGHAGKTYNLVGPDILTGPRTAEIWSKALGRTIAYGGNDLDAWEQQNLQWSPAFMVFDFRLMYQFFQERGLKATPEDIATLTKLLGHAPRSYEAYVKEMAAAWTT